MKVAVLGAAGGIGQALALLLKTQLPSGSELSLYDIAPVTPGVAVDLSHIPTDVKIKGFSGEDATPALEGADVVLISAGVARKPGMDRSDLFNVNAGIVKNLVQQIAKTCPQACIGIITDLVDGPGGCPFWSLSGSRHAGGKRRGGVRLRGRRRPLCAFLLPAAAAGEKRRGRATVYRQTQRL